MTGVACHIVNACQNVFFPLSRETTCVMQANLLKVSEEGEHSQPMDDRKDHTAEPGLRLSRTKDTRPGERNVQEMHRPQLGGSLADTEGQRPADPSHSLNSYSARFPHSM